MRTFRVSCDAQCGEALRYRHEDEKADDGWIEVWKDEDDCLDFCSRACLVEYFQANESEED